MASAPRKIFRLPSMWATTKPTRTIPVTAITTFLPIMVPHNVATGLLGHTVPERRPRAGGACSAVMPASVERVIDWLILSSASVRVRRCQAPRLLVVRLGRAGSDMCANRDRAAAPVGSEKQPNVIQGHPDAT